MRRKYIRGPYIPTHYDKEDAQIMKNLRRETDEHNRAAAKQKSERYQAPKNIPVIRDKKSWWPF